MYKGPANWEKINKTREKCYRDQTQREQQARKADRTMAGNHKRVDSDLVYGLWERQGKSIMREAL